MIAAVKYRSENSSFFFLNAAITLLAGNIANYGVVLYANEITQTRSYGGFVFFSIFAGTTAFTLYAGTLLDRKNRLHVVLLFQPVYVLSLATLAVLSLRRPASEIVFILPVLTFVNGISVAFLFPGRFALLSMLLDDRQLAAATATLNIVIVATYGLAPLVYGVARAYLGWPALFAVLSLSYAIGGILLGAVRLPAVAASPPRAYRVRSELSELRRACSANPVVGGLLLLNACGQLTLGAVIVLLPQFAQGVFHLGEIHRGMAMACVGIGQVSGGLIACRMSDARTPFLSIVASLAASGAILMCIPLAQQISVFVMILLSLGLASGFCGALLPALIQAGAPDAIRGRILGLYSLTCLVSPAVSGLVCGVIADAAGMNVALLVCGSTVLGGAAAIGTRLSLMKVVR